MFADDDELADRYWLAEMVRGFDLSNAIACVTGLVLPMESETQSQEWFEQFGGYCKGGYDRQIFNLTTHRSDSPLYPYNLGSFGSGGSMAFRRSILCELGDSTGPRPWYSCPRWRGSRCDVTGDPRWACALVSPAAIVAIPRTASTLCFAGSFTGTALGLLPVYARP